MPAFLTAEEYLRKKGLVSGKEVIAKRYKFADRSDLLTLRNDSSVTNITVTELNVIIEVLD